MKNIFTLSLMLLSAIALPSQATSLTVTDTMEGTLALLSTNGSTIQNGVTAASILWKYEIAANDSEDKAKNAATVQRSTKAEYLIDCAKQTVALNKWQMFNDADGQGNVVWADQSNDRADFYLPVRRAERSLVGVACEVKTALQ
jgi:hypothetical protein